MSVDYQRVVCDLCNVVDTWDCKRPGTGITVDELVPRLLQALPELSRLRDEAERLRERISALESQGTAASAARSDDREHYESYKLGWLLGASSKPKLAAAGAPAPKHAGAWERGHDDGRVAFSQAMKRMFHALELDGDPE